MTQGTGVLPRHSRKEKCLFAGAFRRSGARAPSGRSTEGRAPVLPSFRSGARNPPESDKKRGDPSHSFGMTQGTGVLPRHSRKEKCLLAGAFRRSGAEPQRGEVGACHPPPVIPSEQGVSLRRGIPWQGTGCNKRGGPSRARARIFRRALLPLGMTWESEA